MAAATQVLLIDDNDLVRQAFARVLRMAGFTILEAEDGEIGLEIFREASPAAVLVDLRMPGLDGLDVLSRLAHEAPDTPVIVVSGEGTMTDALSALRLGAWDYVTKPLIQPEILAQTVTRALDKARLMRENREHRARLEELNQRLSQALGELEQDQEAGRRLQRQLLPPDGLTLGPWALSRRLFPSHALSGDFVDYFRLGERYMGIYLADVSGHGSASAFVTAMLGALMAKYREAFAQKLSDVVLQPDRTLEQLNRDLLSRKMDKHATMFYAVVDLERDRMVWSNAGQFPFPAVFGRLHPRFVEQPGRPLGIFPDARYSCSELDLGPIDRLVVVSDGVLTPVVHEGAVAVAKPQASQQLDLVLRVGGAAADVDALASELGVGNGCPREDDVTLLMMQRTRSMDGSLRVKEMR